MSEMFDLIDRNIQYYCDNHTSDESRLLYELYRETHLTTPYPRMLSSKSQGAFLQMISRMLQPERVLELGTFTGYSTISLAEGLTNNGLIVTIEKNPEMEDIIRKYIVKAGLEDKVKLLIGDALELIPAFNETWDLIFIDADKINCLTYYNMLLPFLSDKGMMLVDNVLWSGKVIEDIKCNDRDTQAIVSFNAFVQQDVRVKNMILPFRDGMMMIQKIKA
jgi:predicted O-methyltransferase YrrM